MNDSRRVRMVKGPATVVIDGACRVLGRDVSGQTVPVRAGKALPFEAYGRCNLRVRLGRGGRTWMADPAVAGISMWRNIADKLLAKGRGTTVMLVGDTDSGKTTFATYVANAALERGIKPYIVDGDIGQGDLAPPGAIGAAALSAQVTDLRDVHASLFEFVGNTSPAGLEDFVAKKLGTILEKADALGDFCIVNTDGYVRGGGILYKLRVAEELQPDSVVCLGANPTLAGALLKAGPWQVVRARSSRQVSKSGVERTGRRLEQFLRYFGSRLSSAELKQIKFVYRGTIYSPTEMLKPPMKKIEHRNVKNMFVGLGSGNEISGFGIVTNVDFDRIEVQTDIEAFDKVYLSDIRLSGDKKTEVRIS